MHRSSVVAMFVVFVAACVNQMNARSDVLHRTRHHSSRPRQEVSYHLDESSSPDLEDDGERERMHAKSREIVIANYTGDIVIAAIFPVHERMNYSCGSLQTEGLQQMEALVYSMHRINNNSKILPGIKLGLMITDSCDSPHHALAQTTVFIKSFIARMNARQMPMDFKCSNHSLAPVYKQGHFDRVVGLIGGQSSETSIQLANLLRLFQIPQVSYMSTSPTLSDKRLYEYFFRTVPSDTHQAEAIVELLKQNRWTYVSIVYSNTEYGNNGYNLITSTAARFNICISSPQMINAERFQDEDYDNTIVSLTQKTNAKVVIVYSDRQAARKILMAAARVKQRESRNRQIVDQIIWIASDAWCCRESVTHGLEDVIEGSISVTPQHYHLEGFSDYFRSLRPETNARNPWFAEFWEQHFNCSLNAELGKQACHPDLSLGEEISQSPTLHFIRDAFYSYSFTFQHIHEKYCHKKPGLCAEMERILWDGRKLARRLRNVNFNDEGNRTFQFLENGDAPPRYRVVNFRKTTNGTGSWFTVGDYLMENNNARLNISQLRFKHNSPLAPQSFCSQPCGMGQAKLQLEGDTCCWLCTNCSEYQIIATHDEFNCLDCPKGTLPNLNRTECVIVPSQYLSLTNWWSIGAIILALVGMLMTFLTWYVFWYYAETPIIKAAGRELSNLLLAGIFLSFATTFVIISPPMRVTCSLTRFLLGFCYTICYSAIFTKTNRIARIFRNRSCQRPKFISPRSQLVITFFLIAIELLINLLWMVYDPPDTMSVYPSRDTAILICSGSDRTSYLLGLVYPLILICFCTVYAFKTRKCPEGFNEARYITFTNYTTCVVWLAFLPLYVMLGSSSTPWRSITLCLLLSVSATVQLFCLFVPKMYIALLKPEKNTRETVMFRMPNAVSYPHYQLEQKLSSNGGEDRLQLRKSSSANDAETLLGLACAKNRLLVEPVSISSEVETTTTTCCNDRQTCCGSRSHNNNSCLDVSPCRVARLTCCCRVHLTPNPHHHRCLAHPAKHLTRCASCCYNRDLYVHSSAKCLSACDVNSRLSLSVSPASLSPVTTPSPKPDLSLYISSEAKSSNQSINSSQSSPSTVVNTENASLFAMKNGVQSVTCTKCSKSTPCSIHSSQTNGNCHHGNECTNETRTVQEPWPSVQIESQLSDYKNE